MSTRTVTTQAELDTALTDSSVERIILRSEIREVARMKRGAAA